MSSKPELDPMPVSKLLLAREIGLSSLITNKDLSLSYTGEWGEVGDSTGNIRTKGKF